MSMPGPVDHEAMAVLGDILAGVEAGRQGVDQTVPIDGKPELVLNACLVLISMAIDAMDNLQPGAGQHWYAELRKFARGERQA